MTALAEPLPDEPSDPDGPAPPERHRAAEVSVLRWLFDRTPRPESLAVIARARAEHAVWPPPVEMPPGSRWGTTEPRPLVVGNGLTAPSGCARYIDDPQHGRTLAAPGPVRCVPAGADGWRCPACQAVTPMPEPMAGPRVAECDCLGPVVCLHRTGRR